MPVKLTISIDEYTEQAVKALARKRKTTVSSLIRDLVREFSAKDDIQVPVQGGLGTLLRAPRPVDVDPKKDYKTLLSALREENHATKK